MGFCRRSTATAWRNTSSSASFDAEERASSTIHPGQANEYQVEHPYSHKPAMLPAIRPRPQPYAQVSDLCPVLEPRRVGRLILLNTYYGHAPALRLPEMIRLLADPDLIPLADAMMDDSNQRLWVLAHTGRQFGLDAADQQGIAVASIVPQFYGDQTQPDALAAIRAWTSALFPALDQQDAHIAAGDLAGLDLPVTLIFGAADDYLNPRLARHLAGLFPHADLHLVDNASHWPQWYQPEIVAQLIKHAAPT